MEIAAHGIRWRGGHAFHPAGRTRGRVRALPGLLHGQGIASPEGHGQGCPRIGGRLGIRDDGVRLPLQVHGRDRQGILLREPGMPHREHRSRTRNDEQEALRRRRDVLPGGPPRCHRTQGGGPGRVRQGGPDRRGPERPLVDGRDRPGRKDAGRRRWSAPVLRAGAGLSPPGEDVRRPGASPHGFRRHRPRGHEVRPEVRPQKREHGCRDTLLRGRPRGVLPGERDPSELGARLLPRGPGGDPRPVVRHEGRDAHGRQARAHPDTGRVPATALTGCTTSRSSRSRRRGSPCWPWGWSCPRPRGTWSS